MKLLLLIISLIFLSFQSDGQRRWRTIKPITDTSYISELLVYHCECTGSKDIDVDSGFLKMPDSLKKYVKGHLSMDLSEKQWKRIFGSWKKKRFGYMFLVRGKITNVIDRGYVPKAGSRYTPVFDVYQYKIHRKKNIFYDPPE